MINDYNPGTITPEEERNGDGFKINHRGYDKWLIPLAGFVNKFCRWAASKKNFRVIIDYDPEWSMKVTFRRMTQAEAELKKNGGDDYKEVRSCAHGVSTRNGRED